MLTTVEFMVMDFKPEFGQGWKRDKLSLYSIYDTFKFSK